MKVSEYKQMMAYLTRPGTKKENLKQIIKKSKPDNAVTDTLKLNGKKVIVAIVALGSMCLNIIFVLETPNAFAALI